MHDNPYQTVQDALELASYRCSMNTFCSFLERVERAILAEENTEELEQEIRQHIKKSQPRVFNIHKAVNDPLRP